MGAEFKVVWVDRKCSGFDYGGHLGTKVYNARRCCKNCSIIYGDSKNIQGEFGPFSLDELEPLNEEARAIKNELEFEWPFIYPNDWKSKLIRFMKRFIQHVWLLNFMENWIYKVCLCYRVERERGVAFTMTIFNSLKDSWPIGKSGWVP